eukprot:7693003-Lingulodinium_polyedra.AAC.1
MAWRHQWTSNNRWPRGALRAESPSTSDGEMHNETCPQHRAAGGHAQTRSNTNDAHSGRRP